jgi:hypothetical protein
MEQEDYSKLHHVSSKAFCINQIVEQKSGWQDGKERRWEQGKFQHSRVSKRLVRKNEG